MSLSVFAMFKTYAKTYFRLKCSLYKEFVSQNLIFSVHARGAFTCGTQDSTVAAFAAYPISLVCLDVQIPGSVWSYVIPRLYCIL